MKAGDFKNLAGGLALPSWLVWARDGLLVVQPVKDLLRGVVFEASGSDKGRFYVNVFVQPLFVPVADLPLNLGWRLGGPSHRWDRTSPTLMADLQKRFEEEILPFFERVRSPAEVPDSVRELRKTADPIARQAAAYALAWEGDAARSIAELKSLATSLRVENAAPWQVMVADRAILLAGLLERDPREARLQLEAWEVGTIRALGLEKRRRG